MSIKIAINGFGRIGRAFFKQALERPELEVIAVNDLTNPENLAYLLAHDTVYGRYNQEVKVKDEYLLIGDKKFLILNEREPEKLPWKKLQADVVVESTGVFTSKEKAQAHLRAGAKRVVISAQAQGGVEHLLCGANEDKFSVPGLAEITSNASCTTNAIVPVAAVLMRKPGIKKAVLTTTHAYTASQSLVDGPKSGNPREGRAAAQNIIPTTTGAAEAAARSLPSLEKIFDGIALRVPVVCGSLIDFTFLAERKTTAEEINQILRKAAQEEQWQKFLKVSEEPLVSSDIIGTTHASIVDATFTRVIDGDLVKVLAWYDNEWAYAYTLVEHVIRIGKLLGRYDN